MGNKTGFDGLTKAHVVGDEEIHPWHGERAHDRIELILAIAHIHAGAEGRLESLGVGGGNGAPRHGIKKGVKAARIVEAFERGQAGFFNAGRARLDLPNHRQLFSKTLILH